MKRIIIVLIAIMVTGSLFAQNNISDMLSTIEKNNTTLKALRETVNSQKLENRTDIFLDDLEIGFNYLWGSPSPTGNRQDYSITQSFDIPTILGLKSKLANHKNELLEWQYKVDRMNIMLEAKNYCLDLIYYNALLRELSIRLDHAQIIASVQKERLDKGEGNILEYNNVQLNLATVKGEIARVKTERNSVKSQLSRLNGGEDLSCSVYEFTEIQIPIDFLHWYDIAETKSPVLAYVKQEVMLNKEQLTLSKSMGLPTFSAGYVSENVVGQRYQGVSLGVSIPLWSNKNKVKQAKTAIRAAESREIDSKQQFLSQLEILYDRTIGLKTAAENYRASLSKANNSTLLKKALDAGEISMLDYIVEIGLYYNTINQALEAERDYQKAFATLSAIEL